MKACKDCKYGQLLIDPGAGHAEKHCTHLICFVDAFDPWTARIIEKRIADYEGLNAHGACHYYEDK